MLEEERMNMVFAELSEEMDTRKRQWRDLARIQFRREDTVEEMKGDYQRSVEHTEHMMIELENFFYFEILTQIWIEKQVKRGNENKKRLL